MSKSKKSKKQLEQEYKREAIWCIIATVLGWIWLGVVFESVALWRSIHVLRHTSVDSTKSLAILGIILSSISLAVLVISLVFIAAASV